LWVLGFRPALSKLAQRPDFCASIFPHNRSSSNPGMGTKKSV